MHKWIFIPKVIPAEMDSTCVICPNVIHKGENVWFRKHPDEQDTIDIVDYCCCRDCSDQRELNLMMEYNIFNDILPDPIMDDERDCCSFCGKTTKCSCEEESPDYYDEDKYEGEEAQYIAPRRLQSEGD